LQKRQQFEREQHQKFQTRQQLQNQHHLQKQQPQLQKQQQQPESQQPQPLTQQNQQTFQKKQQEPRFCSPWIALYVSQSSERKVQNIENPNNDEVEYGGQLISVNASKMGLEREAENEVQPMDQTDNVAHERESEILIGSSSEAPKTKKHRGPTKKTDIHARTTEERTPIILNCYGQPIRPTPKDVQELSQFLGTVARNTELAPLNYVDWPSLPTHDQIWEYVLEKYMIAPEERRWVIGTVNETWRQFKCRVKQKYLDALEYGGSKWNELYELVPEDELNDLITYWNTSPAKKQSKKNKRNRQVLHDMHTMGPKSYATLRHKLQQEDPNKQEPLKAKLYKISRIRNPNNT
ncbi:Transcription factor MYB3R-2, partial [Bienertia sinuspersici]